jgi:PAS domain S-box-containing protein
VGVPGGDASFLNALLESLTVGVIACDADGEVVLVNRPVRELMNLSADAALRDYPQRAAGVLFDVGGNPVPWSQAPVQRAVRGEVVETDMVVRIPGRRERTVAVVARPIPGGDGRHLGAVAIAREVTELRRAERFRACHRAVEQALQAGGSAVDAAPGVLAAVGGTLGWPAAELWLADEDSGELSFGGRWCAPGSGLEAVLGFAPVKGAGITGRVWVTGRPLWVPDIAHTVNLRSPLERTRAAACLRHGIRSVLAVPVRDGTTVLGVLTCYAAAPEPHEDLLGVLLDGVAALIGVYVARRRAEALARQLTRAKDDFIALVGHEMRTPLTSIVASASMLDEDAALDEESRAMLDAVQRNATALRGVVDTLLDLAGLDSGYLTLTIGRVDLAAVVASAIAAAEPHARINGVRLDADRSAPLLLDGDADRLRQVADDLLSNAVKYSPRGGDVHVGLREHGTTVELTVTDNGIGTPAEDRERVFDRFYRAGNVRHQGIAGKGLGLSRARAIVSLHGGTIGLTGRQPHGTTVQVRLPLRRT